MVAHMSQPLLAVLVGLAVCQLALLVTTMYLHRTLAHRAMWMKPWLSFTCRALLWLTTGMKAREWAAVHRRHHAHTDVPGDPHSPVLEGYWKVQLYNAGLYRAAAHDAETLRKYSRDIAVDSWDRALFDHGFLATNNQWLALLTWGEGLHSNHHAAPTSPRLSFKRSEVDPGWWVTSLLKRLGWLRVRHDGTHLARTAQQAGGQTTAAERVPDLVT
jgi:stearoyl-CoA desaturase (delta-9 desaturase)